MRELTKRDGIELLHLLGILSVMTVLLWLGFGFLTPLAMSAGDAYVLSCFLLLLFRRHGLDRPS